MLIYLGAIAILFVFGVMLVHSDKEVSLKTERGVIPFLVMVILLFLLTAAEAVTSVDDVMRGVEPEGSTELLNIGFNMYHYLGNSLFVSFLMLCVPMVAIMLFVNK